MSESTDTAQIPEAAEAVEVDKAVEAVEVELTAEQIQHVEDLEEAMRDVVDPELGINVVDLGLVYGLSVDAENICTLDMTLTSAACPLTDVIEDQSRNALVRSGLVEDLKINWVWMPPWGPDKITDDGREQLRALGFTV
ncbi:MULTISPECIES: metal-sulfur cluster assembly factor [Nocardia]|uniref:Metal-sulfur cluster assembly factor n=1 Tax=Nocardia salmonicida TaxID=53431 RepID=A0ABZ1N4Z7_9NOCA|nr:MULTISPECIES: metal-sulfur cluster assembly factor [Nocardia]KQY37745.1 metal-sulfur cluster biosynthetic enzyme [Nocardia sp. Root136]